MRNKSFPSVSRYSAIQRNKVLDPLSQDVRNQLLSMLPHDRSREEKKTQLAKVRAIVNSPPVKM
jgi:hypothetical protein